jgi:uncharacterized protein YegJ (DUF2314 family)
MRFHIGLILCALITTAAAQTRDHNEVVQVENEDPEMTAAIHKARRSLDQFLLLAANPPAGTSGFKLKVMVKDSSRTEHFWVAPFKRLASGFEGELANEPRVVSNVKHGQIIRFSRDEISDWGYMRGSRQVGSETVCVLFKRMPKDQANYYRKNHGFDC